MFATKQSQMCYLDKLTVPPKNLEGNSPVTSRSMLEGHQNLQNILAVLLMMEINIMTARTHTAKALLVTCSQKFKT